MYHKFAYEGPVTVFGKSIGSISVQTMAESEAKAKNNIMYQIKKKMNVTPGFGGVELYGKIKKID